jgi:hypothetical protein
MSQYAESIKDIDRADHAKSGRWREKEHMSQEILCLPNRRKAKVLV